MGASTMSDEAGYEVLQSISPDDVIIVVMGMTGAGKSSFIANCTREQLPVIGHGLRSCTTKVSVHTLRMAERNVHLIDTPGLNDSLRSDGETFQELAYWLAAAHENKLKLSGIVYLHRITDTRLHGSAHRALQMFKAMCGPQGFKSVVVATTMWDRLFGDDVQKAHARQVQLERMIHDDMIAGGGRLVAMSAGAVDMRKILAHIIVKDVRITLAFQTEHVDRGLPLHMTGAGKIVYESLCTSLTMDKRFASEAEAESRTAKSLDSLRATREEVQTSWSARIKEEDDDLDRIQRLIAEHALQEHLLCKCSSLAETSTVFSSSQGSPPTSAASQASAQEPSRPDSSLDQESTCQSLRLQQDGIIYRHKHRLDRRRIAHGRNTGRTTTIGVVGTGLAVAQLAAAVACNVM